LQASVVGLGFGMNLHQVVQAGRSGFVYTMLGISFAMLAGMGLGALFGVRSAGVSHFHGHGDLRRQRHCRVGPITQASDEEMAVRWERSLC
jgi:hypothetical protein